MCRLVTADLLLQMLVLALCWFLLRVEQLSLQLLDVLGQFGDLAAQVLGGQQNHQTAKTYARTSDHN
jgi:hypothetical protein